MRHAHDTEISQIPMIFPGSIRDEILAYIFYSRFLMPLALMRDLYCRRGEVVSPSPDATGEVTVRHENNADFSPRVCTVTTYRPRPP